ncbi:hypothetical protein [Amycolatopsis sp. A1MSW2902]
MAVGEVRSGTSSTEATGRPIVADGPVLVSLVQDSAVYVEPNVWVEHRRP